MVKVVKFVRKAAAAAAAAADSTTAYEIRESTYAFFAKSKDPILGELREAPTKKRVDDEDDGDKIKPTEGENEKFVASRRGIRNSAWTQFWRTATLGLVNRTGRLVMVILRIPEVNRSEAVARAEFKDVGLCIPVCTMWCKRSVEVRQQRNILRKTLADGESKTLTFGEPNTLLEMYVFAKKPNDRFACFLVFEVNTFLVMEIILEDTDIQDGSELPISDKALVRLDLQPEKFDGFDTNYQIQDDDYPGDAHT